MNHPSTIEPRRSSFRRSAILASAAAVLTGMILVPVDPLHDLAVHAPDRVAAARFTVTSRYHRCTEVLPAGATIPTTRCAPRSYPATPSLRRLARRVGAKARHAVDPAALHTSALMDLLWADSAGKRMRVAINSLEHAARLTGKPAVVLADLSGAYLASSEQTQDPRDLLEALEIADAATEADPGNLTARFNLALSLQRLGLDDQATAAWQAYLALDSRSEWADEARARIDAVARTHTTPPPETSDSKEVMAYVVRNAPQAGQLLGWDELLAQWGDAVDGGARQQAEHRLGLAAEVGSQVARRGGDASLASQVALIRKHSQNARETQRLARAHRAYGRARRAYRNGDYETADTLLSQVLRTASSDTPLYQWASVFHSSTQGYRSLEQGEALVRGVLPRIDTIRHPALAGRARWILGTILLRSTRPGSAVKEYEAASRLLEQAGEPEHLGIVEALWGTAKHQMGDERAAYEGFQRGLRHLHPYRESPWLHTALYEQAAVAVSAGRWRAGIRILNEQASVARRTGIAIYVAESLSLRARLLGSASRGGWTDEDLLLAHRAVERIPQGRARRWFTNELREAAATRPGPAPSASAEALLDSVVAGWNELAAPMRAIAPLISRADANLGTGNHSAAERRLLHALELLDTQRADIERPIERAVFLDGRAGVFNRLVMLRVRAGRVDEALDFVERGRLSYTAIGENWRARPQRPAPQSGQTVLDYALIGDTLLIWTLYGGTATLTRRTVQREALVRQIEQVRTLLELGGDEAAARPALQALYAVLVAPVEDRLGRAGTPLVVVADGEIAGVPFAALWNPRTQRYLVESRVLRFAPTLADARQGAYAGAWEPAKLLVVADPAFDRAAFPGLGRLEGALHEARALVRRHPGALLLEDEAATRAALLEALSGADMVHYAGHALFDDERPERSQLVLAPPSGASGRAGLGADEISQLRLPRLRLVVLAACETLRSRNGRSGGFAGLSSAFLAAGAHGVMGSLWRANDHATKALTERFYSVYDSTGNGADALASAQRQMLRATDPALRSPAAWAGFRYAGN